MNNQGFKIIELRVTGQGREDAVVTLQRGLNVISGPSDTGKSYIFECISFMLGSSKRPQELEKEDIGYEHVFLQIESYDNHDYTIRRDFNSTHFLVWNKKYSEAVNSSDYETYYLTNKNHPEKLITTFYMKFVDGVGLKIKTNQRGATGNLTFSLIRPYFQVNETKIQKRESFLLQGDRTITAQNRSSFRSFLTKLDDKECKEVEKKEVQVAKISGKIEYLEEQEHKLSERISQKNEELNQLNKEDIIQKINNLSNIISVESQSIKDASDQRFKYWEQLKRFESQLIYNRELLDRFSVLKKTYDDDLSRLEFIAEGSHYLSQLEDINCPTCNQPIPGQTKSFEDEKAGLEAEKKNIEKKEVDLSITITGISNENDSLQGEVDLIRIKLKEIDRKVSSELKSKINSSKEELLQLDKGLRDFSFLEKDVEELAEVKARISHYSELKVSGNQKTDYTNELNNSVHSDISSEVYKLLESWHYNDLGSVNFDDDSDDFRINGKSRLSHGQGHRALLYAAYLIGLLNYCKLEDKETLHPNLVILDSPLTAYKEKDKTSIPEDDIIPHDTEAEFFKSLSHLKDTQIIIFDNKEPNEIPENQVHHIHFTKNRNDGRSGFFPI